MKPFQDSTTDKNEKTIKRGRTVPSDAVNIAWVKSPRMTTDQNVVLIDTSQIVDENTIKDTSKRKLYYANSIGVLEDRFGNQVVEDEHPIVSDVFLADEDFSTVPAEEYEDYDVLPFVHISRFFHADFAGLTLHNDLFTYRNSKIKVIYGDGREYLDDDGNKRYKVKICTAYSTENTSNQNAYRLHVFLDDDSTEELYLTYNKIEINAAGKFFSPDPYYKEIINPSPYYDYVPEESEVVDPANRDKRIYSTRPTALKEQILGDPIGTKDGYKVYVPKKALADTRLFQLFRWRVTCNFKQQFKVDPSSPAGIRCGIIVTKDWPSPTPYAFLNLSRSQNNIAGMNFYNPLKDADATLLNSDEQKETAEYWEVDLDKVSYSDLGKFDILLWSPRENVEIDLKNYAAKIDFFTRTQGGTLLLDTNGTSWVRNLWTDTSVPVNPKTGNRLINSFKPSQWGVGFLNFYDMDSRHEVFEGALAYGGWNFNDDPEQTDAASRVWLSRFSKLDEFNTLTIRRSLASYDVFNQVFNSVPPGWETLVKVSVDQHTPWVGDKKAVMITRTMRDLPNIARWYEGFNWVDQFKPDYLNVGNPTGNIVFTTMGVASSVNALVDYGSASVIDWNKGRTLAKYDDYRLYINSSLCEGAYKFLYNLSLIALKNKPLDQSDEKTYSTVFAQSSAWRSSWVIDGEVLSESERSKNDFALMPTDHATPVPVWQRKLSNQNLRQIINASLTSDLLTKVASADREYYIETSNGRVDFPADIDGNSLPYAWTNEYSPRFEVPVELGPNVIRSSEIKADFEQGEYIHKSYPAKPYAGNVVIDFIDSEELHTIQPVGWTATGTASQTRTTGTYSPPSTTSRESEVQLSWGDAGSKVIYPSNRSWEKQMPVPSGIETWQNDNYYSSAWGTGQLNWPSYGLYQKLNTGSRGEVVTWVQDALNVFQFYGIFHYGTLALTGNYDARTKACVLAFQQAMGARYLDGVIDGETFSLIGSQVIRLGDLIYSNRANSGWSRFYYWPRDRMLRQSISDGKPGSVYSKRSWTTGGPSIIWDMFMLVFSQKYNIHGVTFVPYVDGNSKTIMFRSVDIRSQPYNLHNYDSRWGSPLYLPYRPKDSESLYVPFNPRYGDSVIIGIGQDGGSGWGTSRMLGIRDFRAHARVNTTTVTPGVNTIKKETFNQEITFSGISYVVSPGMWMALPTPKPTGDIVTNSVNWHSVTVDNPNVSAFVKTDGVFGPLIYLGNYVADTRTQTTSAYGKKVPEEYLGATGYYWMNPDTKKVSGLRESGWISKTDGVKVLCSKAGAPIGFPDSTPSLARLADEQQRHYARMRIESIGNDPAVQMSFYDISKREFITNANGTAEMSFIEYLQRGRENIYIAVVSSFETETKEPLPPTDDAPLLPYKWAMPVYGLYKQSGSKIGIGKLPKNLGINDVWPIPVKIGTFEKPVYIDLKTTGWAGAYQRNTLTAHYSIPEARSAEWSDIWGPPNADVIGEQPMITDANVLQVSQAPIYARVVPTPNPSMADPMHPVFTVYSKIDSTSAWEKVPMSKIKDYNLSTGEIFLSESIESSDPSLWRVDYTTARKEFFYKGIRRDIVDLNPYSILSKRFLNDPTYIYIIPQHVRDRTDKVIPESVEQSTIRTTMDPSIFDATSPNHNPLAVELGVIYLNAALNIKDLTILDARKRGGGAKAEATLEEIKRITQDAQSYWDISQGDIRSYQKGGFVIIRLPSELKSVFTEDEIMKVIEKNITAGVKFKVEDLSGKDWS